MSKCKSTEARLWSRDKRLAHSCTYHDNGEVGLSQEYFFEQHHVGVTEARVRPQLPFHMLGDLIWPPGQKFYGNLLPGLPAEQPKLAAAQDV